MFAAGLVDEHGVTVVDLAGQQHTGQLVAHFGLYQAAQVSRPVLSPAAGTQAGGQLRWQIQLDTGGTGSLLQQTQILPGNCQKTFPKA